VASRIDLDLAKILHGLSPEFVKAFRQAVREFAIPDEQRRESPLLDPSTAVSLPASNRRACIGKDNR